MVCSNGNVIETGHVRYTGTPLPIQECPQLPRDCGPHPQDSKWWSETGTLDKTCELCPNGDAHLCQMAQESESVCTNGVVVPTGNTREGKFLSYENECLPLKPKDCGAQAAGSLWWETSGQETASCQTCWDGKVLQCQYNRDIQKTCDNGVVKATGVERQGSLLGTIGQCATQPKNCGDILDGQTGWQENGQEPPYDCDKCLDGSSRKCLRALEQQMQCTQGALAPTGQTRDGKFLGYLTSCPTNIIEKNETIIASAVAGKADILVVLDTTPSMFKSLNNLGARFSQLISAWSRIDWQMGITNSKVQTDTFDRPPLQGRFMALQTNDETNANQHLLKKSNPFASDWFSRTISRDVSDNGCDSQPYCMMNPSEPLRAVTQAIYHKNESTNKGFFRSGAKLVTILISDSDERQGEVGAVKPGAVVDYFNKTIGPSMDGILGLSLIIKPSDSACLKRFSNIFDLGMGGQYGSHLDQYAKLTGGFSASLCDNDYGAALSKLSAQIRQDLESITLKDFPYQNSLQITFIPSLLVHWTLQGKKVIFDRSIPAGTQINLHYLVKTN